MSRAIAGLLVGRTLADRYRIDETIGSGGMSVIYRARDERLGRDVAVKVISLPEESDDVRHEHRERLRREAASAARIPPHPNVVQVYDYGTDPVLDLDFIVMELLRGRDLKHVLREQKLDPQRALSILCEAARGVAAGHRVGIVHRDVKPANILLVDDEDEGVKILDFGIAKALEFTPDQDLTRTGFLPHSPAYASPEQMRPGTPLTPASDVYQLGLVAYETLAGERPYGEGERVRLAAGEAVEVPERGSWAQVPGPLRSVVERALRPRPEDRFPDAAAFARALASSDDATVILPAAAPGDVDGTRTVRLPPAATADEPAPTAPVPWRLSRAAGLTIAGVTALLTVLLLFLNDRSDPPPAAPDAAQEELQGEFRDLTREAYKKLQEAAAQVQGEEAASAVISAIREMSQAWVNGDLERHLAFYDDRVDFYGRDLSRQAVGEVRKETLERYPEREITLLEPAVTFLEPGRARALVTRRWEMEGDDRWQGEARQELVLVRRGESWRVVRERDL